MLTDKHGRKINYLRLAVTDRCNLRCTYCMPEEGLDWLSRKELMTDEEMLRICSVFTEMGVDKIRITGGEPFIRKNFISLLENIAHLNGLDQLTITTNGLLTEPHVPKLKELGITSVNLSLDTLDKDRFFAITRRNSLDKVLKTIDTLLQNEIHVKINAVVMENSNIEDLIPLAKLTEDLNIDVRFIEEMPFNGGSHETSLEWNFIRILEHLKGHFPSIVKINDPKHSTSYNYKIPGFKGDIGIIAAYTRSFCGDCNRIRITPSGVMRTCLYDAGTLNLKDAMREGKTDEELKEFIELAIQNKPKDGWEAEKFNLTEQQSHQSMATIGG
ncbi:molybdenum cofactor biosynthesis protein MoaA [Chryseobacterium piperi]|uniref:GTP 3',8-cyclase n=1 Tax=Chryseobacterium piperi TaxID=558152 RepID=A0A086AGP1_9FLAO|nr:GTP 3',8-cyclase MoaA [Chryseobacterium piperi]ASW73922.1 GTP 3',8-cyclase MoaA [Chryseobacterium piperi]KFF15855.1 molybdenum cofactor biosynthesis protein MoaA [Chryseobacterium piperi]